MDDTPPLRGQTGRTDAPVLQPSVVPSGDAALARAARQLSATAILAHPDFPGALLGYADRLLAIRRGERVMNQLLSQRERELLGFLLLCLHYAHQEGGKPPTLARLAASGLGSPRRIAAFVGVLRLAGMVRALPHPSDRRARMLEPSPALIGLHRDWTQAAFRQLDRLLDTPLLAARLADPAFHRRACLMGAEAVFDGASFAPGRFPLVDFLTPHRGGHLMAASLARALCAAGASPGQPAPPIELPYGKLARRLGVSRSHVLNVFAAAAEKNLLRVGAAGRHVDLSAESAADLFGYFAHELAFIAEHALRACDPAAALDIAWLEC
jgi:AraC-like DNA-binding protein